jgi:hypothetical protein
MRKSYDGLQALARHAMGHDPLDGALYIFVNRRGSSELTEVSALSAGELAVVVRSQAEKIAALEHQLEWFRRQLFGQKSERFAPEPDPSQMHLGEVFPAPTADLAAYPGAREDYAAAAARSIAIGDGLDQLASAQL